MEKAVPQQTGLNKAPQQYYAVYRVTHPASVTAFLGLAHAYVHRRSENTTGFSHHWFIESADSTVITVQGSRNALSLLSEYFSSHTRYISGVEVVYHGWGLKTFKAIADDLYARRLGLREGASR
jgi:folate-dependent phosphoribosylglycinamide formyltransferase PurN